MCHTDFYDRWVIKFIINVDTLNGRVFCDMISHFQLLLDYHQERQLKKAL